MVRMLTVTVAGTVLALSAGTAAAAPAPCALPATGARITHLRDIGCPGAKRVVRRVATALRDQPGARLPMCPGDAAVRVAGWTVRPDRSRPVLTWFTRGGGRFLLHSQGSC